jgi:acyl dehydratase
MAIADVKVGDVVEGRPRTVTLDHMRGFSGWPRRDIHTDEELATASGLPGAIASGTMSEAYLVGLMLDVFGDDWIRDGRMELTFIKVVQPGDVVVPRGRIEEVAPGESETRVTVAIWCENQRGEHVVVGTAWARLNGARP